MKDNNVLLILLRIIKYDGSLEPIVGLGYEYVQIIQFLKDLEVDGFVKKEKGTLSLTDLGNTKMEELIKNLGKKNAEMWIEPEIHSRIMKLDEDDVYLPSQNALWF
jgi:predicted transcriptional regulator